jgi:predicted metalloendopeptidase
MDKAVKPSNNFFRYVNGTWLDNTKFRLTEHVGETRQRTDADALAILKEATKIQNTNQIKVRPLICIKRY